MRPKDVYDQQQPERRAIQLNNLLARTHRHQRAKEATNLHTAMEELRPEITELVMVLMTAHLVRHGEGATDEAIAENYRDILHRVDYAVIQEVLWSQNAFWQKLSSLLMTEALDPTASDDTFPEAESIQVEYDVNDIHRQIINVIEIVKNELQSETR